MSIASKSILKTIYINEKKIGSQREPDTKKRLPRFACADVFSYRNPAYANFIYWLVFLNTFLAFCRITNYFFVVFFAGAFLVAVAVESAFLAAGFLAAGFAASFLVGALAAALAGAFLAGAFLAEAFGASAI